MPVAAERPVEDAPAGAGELAIEPPLEQARELARDYNLIPLRHSFIADCETPVSAFLKLRRLAPQEPAFLLESAEQGQRMGRYSFLGIRPRAVVRWSLGDEGDPYAYAAAALAPYRQAPLPELPHFAGGAVGFFGYDLVRAVEPLGEPNPDRLGLPDMALMLSDVVVVFDHLKHTITVLAHAYVEGEGNGGATGEAVAVRGLDEAAGVDDGDLGSDRVEAADVEGDDFENAYAQARATIAQVRAALDGPLPEAVAVPEPRAARPPVFEPEIERSEFEGMVARIVEYVHAGDAFQVVPSQRWSAPIEQDAFSVYRGLRAVNPSPYMYFLDFGDFQVAGASPEPLLTVTGRTVSTCPIAGTRPRGASAEEDRRIAQELLADEKERAEHVMLVDLGRNDLGRVCEYGSVEVRTFMAVETYSHVMHIVSTVDGRLREGISPMDALRSVLPAGTLSGAPKVRAMQIIDELEPVKRGGYGGAIGYLSYTGDLDTCIHIRTVVVKDGRAYVQAGGGTVADAKPAYEYEESLAKARAVMRAVELAATQPNWP
ncbi:MAG TPA: chorismate-binding protein [Solirubrobacteraceae bacterium]|jgi:anthranilate synthase component 1|nr:chorismate-binding protein [Solirubrobacteraceae bacterium]